MPEEREDRIAVRLEPQDREALTWLTGHLRSTIGAGIRVDASDVVRWALHTCRAVYDQQPQQQET